MRNVSREIVDGNTFPCYSVYIDHYIVSLFLFYVTLKYLIDNLQVLVN